MWVKICGNTNAVDALRASELGADALGFVFAPGKRQVTAAQARAISSVLPAAVERVGVFGTNDAEAIAKTMREAGLNTVQMHGGLNLEAASRLRQLLPDVSIIHVVHWSVGEDGWDAERVVEQLMRIEETRLDERILIDAKVNGASGGLGVAFDWPEADGLLSDFSHLRFVMAGGLRSANVTSAIHLLKPYGVDVATGVESAPGLKDPEMLRLFINAARDTV